MKRFYNIYAQAHTHIHTNYDKTPFTSFLELYNIKVGKHAHEL